MLHLYETEKKKQQKNICIYDLMIKDRLQAFFSIQRRLKISEYHKFS